MARKKTDIEAHKGFQYVVSSTEDFSVYLTGKEAGKCWMGPPRDGERHFRFTVPYYGDYDTIEVHSSGDVQWAIGANPEEFNSGKRHALYMSTSGEESQEEQILRRVTQYLSKHQPEEFETFEESDDFDVPDADDDLPLSPYEYSEMPIDSDPESPEDPTRSVGQGAEGEPPPEDKGAEGRSGQPAPAEPPSEAVGS